jgi:hypothetical protein
LFTKNQVADILVNEITVKEENTVINRFYIFDDDDNILEEM